MTSCKALLSWSSGKDAACGRDGFVFADLVPA